MTDNPSKRALGGFSTRSAVETALNELQSSGFPMNHVSVIAKNEEQ